MATPEYTPTHGTLEERVLGWLRAHPGEALTRQDIASRFNVRLTEIPSGLQAAMARGELSYFEAHANGAGYRLAQGPMSSAISKVFDDVRNPTDISVEVRRDGHLAVSFLLPHHADAKVVAARMLTAAAEALALVKVATPKRRKP